MWIASPEAIEFPQSTVWQLVRPIADQVWCSRVGLSLTNDTNTSASPLCIVSATVKPARVRST